MLLATHKVRPYCLRTDCLQAVADSLLWDQEDRRCTTTALEVTQVTTLVVCSIRCDEVVPLLHPHLFFYYENTYMEGINTL